MTAAPTSWEEAFAAAGTERPMLLPDAIRSKFDEQEWTR